MQRLDYVYKTLKINIKSMLIIKQFQVMLNIAVIKLEKQLTKYFKINVKKNCKNENEL